MSLFSTSGGALLLALFLFAVPARAELTVASKVFTESVILGEVAKAAVATETGQAVVHRRELGGTRIVWNALRAGDVDIYPDYSGTLRFEIFAGRDVADDDALAVALATAGVRVTPSLGFQNNYAVALLPARAAALGVETISDLRRHPDLAFGVSSEFLDRADGWPALAAAYGLPQRDVRGLLHDLAYRALEAGEVDAIDVYTTDPKIAELDLVLLDDDRRHFPSYEAVYVYRADLPEAAEAALLRLAGTFSEEDVQRLNARAQTGGEAEA
ncbi:MAG: glycine betaine ABC transporter substrate-binding protein, partial [Pseudomonadota bacterium]